MKATIKFAREKFNEFNDLIFDGKLPAIPIFMSDSGRALGMLRFERKRNLLGKVSNCNFRMYVSTRYDLPQDQIEDTIIHEMIHLHIAFNNLKDTSTHGDRFKYHMNLINRRFGRHITVSNRDRSINDTDSMRKPHYICETQWRDGSRYITCVARTCIFEVNRTFLKQPGLVSIRWWYSVDPFFNRFPNSRKAKLYRIDSRDYSERVAPATECVCTDTTFQPKISSSKR